ncbi:SGNH/GDSL hydrolase family protein [Mycobacteroides franklinii]|uniref:Lipase 2 n=1 Tax=Mycobacteroides franklinii TaxID=948102 RepID=A0A4R8R795_9MYCO|nr:SGNH/GDSL hydrolase family protein [Mycobacteroides franklinii]ORA61603.1 lipase [Mycobacteroides franklinii]TDH19239.1 SGNH/GDSL hydrolase family protein [Mycobacteroides franklinii]TDZ41963.1 Lipase 2 precursor [Mycobacteroides franklinii]TDZ52111.1 Lipase 2 precursor [Mycobacteroides franklinii]TDZ55518.1 Lipase 2 precursor [Mycobacteroides franklinii]
MSSSPEETDSPSQGPAQRSRLARGLLLSLKIFGAFIVAVLMVMSTATALIAYQGKRAPTGNHEYVALGSSFGAGPGVPNRDPTSPVLCIRSDNNYAHQLARLRHLDLTDVTCSGATAQNVLHGGQYFQPPQLDAVRSDTTLVTITAGGNDIYYLPNLFAWSCAKDPGALSFSWRLSVCDVRADDEVDRAVAQVGASLQEIGREAHRRAPNATVVYVDYTTVLPDAGYCPDKMPITDAQFDRARVLAKTLVAKTEEAARATGSLLVSAAGLTRGHDICSKDPWVYGYTFSATPLNYGPMAYHPTLRAMTAIAAGINKALNTK